ncbi:hypothetical protein JMJ58_18310 [Haloterrigena salifodinae]|uniref:Uncharacterized protein n=1 Tax=Haloterrigena salifodinae TaxID=2675099 RepID=A0A8T8DZC1_9EURY|nr:hypothetical protein [Haloterrigena salifodinae]QRV14849.1 hypothetical protein JMJ58_18310 [Haloterrigena salifodinae]
MRLKEGINKAEIILIGLFLVIVPAVILWFTIGFLMLVGGLALGELSIVELIELYIIELILFSVGSYLLFRFHRYLVTERLPKMINKKDKLQSDNGDATEKETSSRNESE